MAAESVAISALSVAGSSYLTDLEGCTFTLDTETVRNDSVTDDAESEQVQKITGTFDLPLMSTLSNPDRVSDLQVTGFTVGATNALTLGLERASIEVAYAQAEVPTVGTAFRVRQNVKRRVSGSARVAVPNTGVVPLLGDAANTTHSNRVKTITAVVNGVTIEFPALITGETWSAERDGLQMVDLTLGPRKGSVLPSGTTSLLEKALNAYKTPVTISATTTASTGSVISGSFIFQSLSLEIQDGALVMARYQFINTGAFTIA